MYGALSPVITARGFKMIYFDSIGCFGEGISSDNAIFFDDHDKARIIAVFERALNTLSPPDQELLKVLSDMKSIKEQSHG